MGIYEYISNQFSKPSGIGGVISTFVMNKINRKLYESVIEKYLYRESCISTV